MPLIPNGAPPPAGGPDQQGLPPELMALLAGGAGAGGPDPFDAELEQQLAQDQGGGDRLRSIIDIAREEISANGVTEKERLLLEKLTTTVQQIRAEREKEQQAALGGGPATNFLRRRG